MIQSFGDKETEKIWRRQRSRWLPSDIQSRARDMLARLDRAQLLQDLRFPPGNHLEALSGDRTGQHSVRVNRQWRVAFRWGPDGPSQVTIEDYHK